MADDVEITSLRELQGFLGELDDRVDAWLHDAVDDASRFAGERLVHHAHGSIKDLVAVDEPRPGDGGIIVGEAYVDPDFKEDFEDDGLGRGLGSSPADYPYYVDVGTGIYGEFGTPITAFPGGVMGPIEYGGRMIYLKEIKGQPAQHYSDAAARDVDAFLDFRILAFSGKMVAGD